MNKHPGFATRRRLGLALPLLGLGAGLGGGLFGGAARAAAPQSVPHSVRLRSSRELLGTRVDLLAETAQGGQQGEAQLAQAAQRAFAEMQRLAAMMSRYRPDSALSALNLAAGLMPVSVPPELMQVLLAGQALARESAGQFDMTVGALKAWRFEPGSPGLLPDAAELERQRALVDHRQLELDPATGRAFLRRRGMALDLGGIAKLPILDAGLRSLHADGIVNALINGGGDVLYSGQWQGRPWQVGLRDPRRPQALLGVLALQGRGVLAASGDYERFFMAPDGRRQHHILDPHSGRPTCGPCGISLLADDVAAVNGLGAVFMGAGLPTAQRWLRRHPGLEAMVVASDGSTWSSPGMRSQLLAAPSQRAAPV